MFKNTTSPSILGGFWFCLFLLDRSRSRAQNLVVFFSNFKFYKVEFQVFNENFKNATPPSILDGFWFCLFCCIDIGTGHITYRLLFQNSNFIKLNLNNLMKCLKTLLLLQFSMDFGSVYFV